MSRALTLDAALVQLMHAFDRELEARGVDVATRSHYRDECGKFLAAWLAAAADRAGASVPVRS